MGCVLCFEQSEGLRKERKGRWKEGRELRTCAD